MATEQTKQHADDHFSTMHKTLQEFTAFLTENQHGAVDLSAWVNEIPTELRSRYLPELLRTYLLHCNERGLTVSPRALIEEFPEHRDVILDLCGGGLNESQPRPEESVSTRPLEASTTYQVHEQAWKEGGQGTLHKAEDVAIGNRLVVVKYLKDSVRQEDFQKEIEVTAKLDHPGVVAVFSRGVEQDPPGRPFFAMRLIHGKPLEDQIADFHNRINRLSARKRREEFTPRGNVSNEIDNLIAACNTVSHAHSVGVLHCDLKPKNIICGRFGATIVLDWGSASAWNAPQDPLNDSIPAIDLPAASTSAMTLAYASPEQIAHDGQVALTPASDVFSLGATLYQILTGVAPFDSSRTKNTQPDRPREKNPCVSKRLDAICMKAMQLSPENRYPSVELFARDLTNWLRDEPISAIADNLADRSFRFARRHRGVTFALLCLCAVISISGALITTVFRQQQETSRNLDLTLDLIDGVCEPLGNDEVKNLKEFDDIATKVNAFTTDYIDNSQSGEPQQLARIHKIKGIIQFYYFTRDPSDPKQQLSLDARRSKLLAAIESLEEAKSLCSESNVLERARIEIMLARWKRALTDFVDVRGAKSDRAQLMNQSISLLNGVIESLQPENRPDDQSRRESVQFDTVKAEAHHLLGVYLFEVKHDPSVTEAGPVSGRLQRAIDNFGAAINILDVQNGPAETAEIRRTLARAYGYRGDAHRFLGDVEEAAADYEESLKIRREMADGSVPGSDNSIETRFQLARGYCNFGVLIRDFSDMVSPTTEFDDRPRREGETNEDYVLRVFIPEALRIQENLLKNGDKRFTDDLVWTLNVAAELYLSAAEREDAQNSRREDLLKANEFAERAIRQITGGNSESLLESQKWLTVTNSLTANEKHQLARSLMLKLRIGKSGGNRPEAVPVPPILVVQLAKGDESLQNLDEEDLLVYAVATAAKAAPGSRLDAETTADLKQVVAELSDRQYRYVDRLRKLLIGVGMQRDVIDELLTPIAKTL